MVYESKVSELRRHYKVKFERTERGMLRWMYSVSGEMDT
jgi:hypothetical protein